MLKADWNIYFIIIYNVFAHFYFNTIFVRWKLFHIEQILNTMLSECLGKKTLSFKVVILFTVFSTVAFWSLVDFKINNIFFGHFREKKKSLLCKFIIFKTVPICWIPPQGFSPPLFNFCLEILHGEKLKVEHIGVLRCAWPVYARGSW